MIDAVIPSSVGLFSLQVTSTLNLCLEYGYDFQGLRTSPRPYGHPSPY